VTETLVVPSRFNGPLESGNGGYSAGAIATYLGGTAAVRLRRPVPLDTTLEISVEAGAARVLDGEELIAEAERADDFDLEPPESITLDAAQQASTRYRGLSDGQFSHCFVCGLAREDGFQVFAGEVEGRDLVASPWTPPEWTADEKGQVKPEFVWSVLDCPTYFATYLGEDLLTSFLAQMTARIDSRVAVGEEHVVIAWAIDVDGRKRIAGSAVLSADGDVLAVAKALLIEPANLTVRPD
jgi:hypothetical protein